MCQPPKVMMVVGGAVPKWGHRHGGIMSGLPTSQFLNPPPSAPTQWVDNQATYPVEDPLLKR